MRKARRVMMVLFVTAVFSAAQSPASDWASVKALPAGTEIRIAIAKSHRITGKLESATDTSITVNARSIDRQEVTQVEVRSKARRKRSTLIGLAVGAAGGGAFGGGLAAACSGDFCGGHGGAIVFSAIATGAIVGALIGAAVSHGGWREVYKQ